MSRMEKLISDHMIKSKNESAHVQAFIEADITNLWNGEKKIKIYFKKRGGKNNFYSNIHNVSCPSFKRVSAFKFKY
jgi:2-oxoglutarate dehydrogenase E2 component (dihydrolipoamide succinyltransferase)